MPPCSPRDSDRTHAAQLTHHRASICVGYVDCESPKLLKTHVAMLTRLAWDQRTIDFGTADPEWTTLNVDACMLTRPDERVRPCQEVWRSTVEKRLHDCNSGRNPSSHLLRLGSIHRVLDLAPASRPTLRSPGFRRGSRTLHTTSPFQRSRREHLCWSCSRTCPGERQPLQDAGDVSFFKRKGSYQALVPVDLCADILCFSVLQDPDFGSRDVECLSRRFVPSRYRVIRDLLSGHACSLGKHRFNQRPSDQSAGEMSPHSHFLPRARQLIRLTHSIPCIANPSMEPVCERQA